MLDLADDTFTGLVRVAGQIKLSDEPIPAGTAQKPGQQSDADVANWPKQPVTLWAQSGESPAGAEIPVELSAHPRYRIVELIGRGGMGSVYRAEHRLMNRTVAIKLVNSQLVRHPLAVERFHREVQAAARLSHQNIVAAYDAEQAGNAHFLVMEFVDGIDLATIVQHRGPMSVADACRCVQQAADGLQHAHEQGMVHRDIKPHNLMLSAVGQVRILDFGLAGFATESALGSCVDPTAADLPVDVDSSPDDNLSNNGRIEMAAAHLTAMGSVMGTPDYIAPEQAADAHSADIRADIYSLGCTLHFLLTGRPPFEAENVLAKLRAHAELAPPALTTTRPDAPAELANIVARMLAKNPAERFQTPAEVATALAPFAIPSKPPKQPSWRTLAIALAGAAMLLAGVIVILTDKGRLEIRSERDDVDFVVMQNGQVFKTIDLQTGSQITWLPSGDYEIALKQGNSFTNLDQKGFRLSRWGKEIVHVTRLAATPVEAASDRNRLQGTWVAESGERNGQPTPLDQISMQHVVFEGDTMRVDSPAAKKGSGQFQLIESSNPKEIQLRPQVPPPGLQRNDLLRGIYKFEGDRLTLCIDQNQAGPLPTMFAAPAEAWAPVVGVREHRDNDHRAEHTKQIRTLRAKPLTEARLLVDAAPRAFSVSDRDRLQGKWVPVSAKFRGKPLTDEQLARMSITLNGDRAEFTDPDRGQAQAGKFTIDASRTPKHINLIAPDGKERLPGIFEFDGERLKLAWCDGDYARPTDFEPAQTADHMTAVFERVPGSVPTTVPSSEPAAAPVLDETQKDIVKAAEAYLAVIDEGRFGSLRDMVSSMARQQVTREQVSQTYQKLRDTFGKATRRTLHCVQVYE